MTGSKSIRLDWQKLLPPIGFRLSAKSLIWLALAVGTALRVRQYYLGRSLWIDEALIALNLIERSIPELLQPLSYRQGAPIGFLVLEKLALLGLGTDEWVLRLVPFIAGIAALWLFGVVAVRFATRPTAAIALGLLALCDRAIYFSAETKQYSTDMAVTVLLYLVLVGRPTETLSYRRCFLMAATGGLALWFSHPAVFVLAGIGLTLLACEIGARQWQHVLRYMVAFSAWVASFIAFYFLSLRSLTNNEALQESFQDNHDAFLPLLPTSTQDISWFIRNFFGFFDSPLSLPLVGLAALCFVTGVYATWQEEKVKLSFLLSPFLMTLLASGLQQYPIKARLLLFLVPPALLILAKGVAAIVTWLQPQKRWIGVAIVLLLFLHPAYYAAANLKDAGFITNDASYQRVREDIKPVLAYVQQHRQAEDTVYVYYAAQYAFEYYLDRYGFDDLREGSAVWPRVSGAWFEPALPSYPPKLIVGQFSRDDWSIFESEVAELAGRERVWFVFAHARDRRSAIDEEDVYLHVLNTMGTRCDSKRSIEASAYLYNLRTDSSACLAS